MKLPRLNTIVIAAGLILAVVSPVAAQQPDLTPSPSTAQDAALKPKPRPKKKHLLPETQAKPEAARKAQGAADPNTKSDTTPNAKEPVSTKPKKIVIREGGARQPETQIVTGMRPEEASRQRQETEKWLSSADENLQRLKGRILDPTQDEVVLQIHNYMVASRSALAENDIPRGHMLALKANLLADDLVKH